jgi:hypothetical protein
LNSRDYSLWLVPLLAALAVYFPIAGGRPAESIPTASVLQAKGQSAKSKTTERNNSAEKLLASFFGVEQSSDVSKKLPGYELTFIVATMPDPIDSGLGHLFNVHLAAIERAAEAMEYVLDRFEIPWSDKDEPGKNDPEKSMPAERNQAGKSGVTENLPRHQREPAVVLFRKPYEQKLLLLFLVGETPTAGIHKLALHNAFKQIETLCHGNSKPACAEMRLLAPTFSGSVDSLKIALNEFPNTAQWRFKIITGSATAIDKQKFLAGLDRPTEFSATIAHDRESSDAIVRWITRRDKHAKIAFLVEAGTGYGQVTKQREGEENKKSQYALEEKQTEAAGPDKADAKTQTPVLILPYPVHISQLRKATEKAKASEKDSTKDAPRIRPRNLRLSLEEGDDPTDILPSISKFETFSVELVLSNLLSTISGEGIRYVGLFSTDIRDQIFLASEIRRHSPDVILFTVGADLLYLHSDVNLDFQGMLLATTYPLFNKNQLWTYPFNGKAFRVQFPNDTAEAVYNAALALLGSPEQMLEYGHPFDDGRADGGPRKPPLWIAAVGKNDIWPIAHFPNRDSLGYTYESKVATALDKKFDAKQLNEVKLYSRRLLYLFFILAALSIFFSFVLIVEYWPRRRPKPLDSIRAKLPWVFELIGDAVYKEVRPQRDIHLFAFAVALLTLSVILARLLTRYWADLPAACSIIDTPHLTLLPFLVLAVPASVALVLVGRKFFKTGFKVGASESTRRASTLVPVLCMGASPLIVCGVAVFFLLQTCEMHVIDQFFFNLRILNSGSGLSPLPPLFFVAVGGFLYYICSFRRLRALEELPGYGTSNSRAYFMAFGDQSFAGLAELEKEVTRTLKCADFELPFASLVLMLIGVPGTYLFVVNLAPALEVSSFYVFFGLIFLFVYLGLSLTLLRFLCVWWALRTMLRRLDAHPLQASFKTLFGQWRNMPPLNLSASFNPLIALHFSATWAGNLSRRAMQLSELPVSAQRAQTLLESSQRFATTAQWRRALILRRTAQAALCRVSSFMAGVLESSWQVTAEENREREQWLHDARLYLAAQCVAFLVHVFFQLKNLIWFLYAGFLLMLVAVSSYPFEPRESILWFNWVVIIVTVVSTMMVFVQMNRDNVLSHLSDTAPGRLNWTREFITKVLVYGAIPILALLSAQFPESLRQIVASIGALQGGH